MEFQVRRLIDGNERPFGDPEIELIGLDDVEWGQAMAPFVFHEVAVGPEQPLGERPERETPLCPGGPQCSSQSFLGSQRFPVRLLALRLRHDSLSSVSSAPMLPGVSVFQRSRIM